MGKVNKRYKDRLFRLIFGTKDELLTLYNAVNNSNYTNSGNLEITTLEDVVYMGMKNDVSFLVEDILSLYEHQSTYNPNMPLRGLFYLADLYRQYVVDKNLNLYGRGIITLPSLRFVIFYNGTKDEPDQAELRLSDAFGKGKGGEACLEFKATMLNINLGHNQELMERCRMLEEYAEFVAAVRKYLKDRNPLEVAVDCAIEECIHNGILAEFLSKHRAEVQDVILTEYDEQKHMALERKEAKEEGRAEGKAEDILLLLEDIGRVSEELQRRVEGEADAGILEGWLKLAARARSVEEFERKIQSVE